MKKALCMALVLALAATTLTGCRKKAAQTEEAPTAAPGYTATDGSNFEPAQQNSVPDPLATLTPQQRAAMQVGNSDDIPEGEGVPTEGASDELFAPIEAEPQAVETATPPPAPVVDTQAQPEVLNTSAYQYSAVMDDSLDYTFNYPSHWEHIPGIYTVCYREKVEKGDFPARISICRKKLVHTPDDIAMMEQLTSYMEMVAQRYDSKTFQTGTPDKEATFMGHKALSNTYLAYWGNIEVKGYVVGVAINRTLYVLHFCATYADYIAMESVLQYMVRSVTLKDTGKK